MNQHIAHVSILVNDYDEAIDFYVNKFRFTVLEDSWLSDTKRWVLISPNNSHCSILLARATSEEQMKRVGDQTGGRVFLFLHTNDLKSYYQHLLDNEVKIVRVPVKEKWGWVAVFADLYGNLWDLVEPNNVCQV